MYYVFKNYVMFPEIQDKMQIIIRILIRFSKNQAITNRTRRNEAQQRRDLIPVQRKSDDVAGMYDIVNDVFYSSITTQALTAGPVVNENN